MEERYIASVDLGTSKLAVCVARILGHDVQVIYYKETPAQGIRYSYVNNPGKVESGLRDALTQAQQELKIKIQQVIVGLPRYYVRQENVEGATRNEEYTLNLIDTPGHVDFSYEVSRAIAACEGALLVVDATQGIQAQTISNLYLALENDLEIIPVMNKIDLDSAMPEEVADEIVDLLGCKHEDILRCSAKTGEGVQAILDAIVDRIPAPVGDPSAPLQALVFDSVFNPFRGIISYFRIMNGKLRAGDHVKFFSTGKEYDADEVGVLRLNMEPRKELSAGNVGYIISGIKTSKDVRLRPAKSQ